MANYRILPYDETRQGHAAMLGVMVLRCALSAFSLMFGGLGVFFLYLSFLLPELGAYALVFLGAATAIVWSTPRN